MKQALVGQGMNREQENSHLEWPDHTPPQNPSLQSNSERKSEKLSTAKRRCGDITIKCKVVA